MNDFVALLASLVVGVLATLFVSHYYFRRSVSKCLTPYIHSYSSLFRGVESSVREALKISYKGTSVDDILDIQFLIANTGERAIRDIIEPLTLDIPNNCSLLDATILHVSPQGRDVRIKTQENRIVFEFPLLNSNDFFVAKVLLSGKAKSGDFAFRITVDDLPPKIASQPLPFNLIEGPRKRQFELPLLLIGLLFLAIACAIAGLLYSTWPTLMRLWDAGLISSFPENWIPITSAAISVIPAILLLVIGIMMCVGAFSNFSFPTRRRFHLPDDLVGRRFPGELYIDTHEHIIDEKKES